MRLVLVCFAGLILGTASPVFSAPGAPPPKEPALQENFYGVQIFENQVWVVGYYGTILYSKDRGLTWEIRPSPVRNALFRVRFTSPQKGWIAGSYGVLLHSTDSGTGWNVQPTGTTDRVFGLTFAD